MGLTSCQKRLIDALCDNDLKKAKEWAVRVLDEDTTQKNRQWCDYHKNQLNSPDTHIIELPPNIRSYVEMKDEDGLFREDRYFVTRTARNALRKIRLMNDVGRDLTAMDIPYHNATLLDGPSGTGKTMFGEYVAYKMKLPFAYLNFSSLIDSLLGKTAQNLQLIFNFIYQTPCVFMIDEIDCIAINRAKTGSEDAGGEMSRTTICLMQQLDRLPNNVVLIAATNRYDRLDDAVIRRFPNKVEFNPMSVEEMSGLQYEFLESVGIDLYRDCDDAETIQLMNMPSMCKTPSELVNRMVEWLAERIMRQKEKENETEDIHDTDETV